MKLNDFLYSVGATLQHCEASYSYSERKITTTTGLNEGQNSTTTELSLTQCNGNNSGPFY